MADETRIWRALYAAADVFRQQAPWNALTEDYLFGIRVPQTGEIHYCCVTGAGGEHLALIVYPGDAGLRAYEFLQANNELPPSRMFMHQHCVSISFEDRAQLEADDLAQIKQLGLKYRGRRTWPMFRDLTPGLFPWQISTAQAQELTIVLTQATAVCRERLAEPQLFDSPTGIEVLVWELVDIAWIAHWHTPDHSALPLPPPVGFDAARAQTLRTTLPRNGIWECDTITVPTPTTATEDSTERPFFPTVLLVADITTQGVAPPLTSHPDVWQAQLGDHVLQLITEAGSVPREIRLRQPQLAALLKDLAATLGIRLRLVGALPAVEEVADQMIGDEDDDFAGFDYENPLLDLPGFDLKLLGPNASPQITSFFDELLRQQPGPIAGGLPQLPAPPPPEQPLPTRARSRRRGSKE